MRVLVASDLHGSYEAAKALAERFAAERAERIFLLGDLLGGRIGPDTDGERTALLLNVLAPMITAVRGNCDSPFDERRLQFALPAYVRTEIGARRVLLTHGHLYGAYRLPAGEPPALVCEGHTHLPKLARYGGYVALNPGSLASPRGGSRAGYAVVDERHAALKTADGVTTEECDW